jgi:hypothetical protein
MAFVYTAITLQWLLYSCLFRGRCLATDLQATLLPPLGCSSRVAYMFSVILSDDCACDVCDWPRPPSPRLGSQGEYSPTASAAPSLRPLVPIDSILPTTRLFLLL